MDTERGATNAGQSGVRIPPGTPHFEETMRRFDHDDLTGETIAKMWHQIAGVISIIAAVSGVGITLTATAGYFWHKWAVKQHQEAIDQIGGTHDAQQRSI